MVSHDLWQDRGRMFLLSWLGSIIFVFPTGERADINGSNVLSFSAQTFQTEHFVQGHLTSFKVEMQAQRNPRPDVTPSNVSFHCCPHPSKQPFCVLLVVVFHWGEFLINVKALSRVCPHSCLELPGHAEDEVPKKLKKTMFRKFSQLLWTDSSNSFFLKPHQLRGRRWKSSLCPPPLLTFFPWGCWFKSVCLF